MPPGIPVTPERPPYSPQFLAAVLHLQAETARAGHAYRFDQLLDLFSAVRPRAEG
jgi:hypothetical protein